MLGLFKKSHRLFSNITKTRNIGISAHIDSGKTTFTERVLYYSGRIGDIHEVKGSDGIGATMDFMELERERGITIQSAATHLNWKDHPINLIDTPGHVDFTIEVERALRVLDGGVLIVCGVSGVQAQTYTVFKQMERYSVPRIIFINKLDRRGANAYTALDGVQKRLGVNGELLQLPIGEDSNFNGIVDLLKMKAVYFEGKNGDILVEKEIPEDMMELAVEKKGVLLEKLADNDESIFEKFLNEEEIGVDEIRESIKRQCLERVFIPVFVGSAYKNKGVQLALDGVLDFLPDPQSVKNYGFKKVYDKEAQKHTEEETELECDRNKQFVALAFKLEENKFGQLTFCRVYQGRIKKGDTIFNVNEKKKVKISRLVKMHANEMKDIESAEAGEIFALFGIDCASGTTFIKEERKEIISLSTMFVPDPVLSISIAPKQKSTSANLQKALKRFQREDPTFIYNIDNESEELIISGMGELHLQIYCERLKREYNIDCTIGKPIVNYREAILEKINFNYTHKKQTGGAGQFAKISGFVEPLKPFSDKNIESSELFQNQFKSKITGQSMPNEYINAVEKQFYECCDKGPMTGYPIINFKFILEDGQIHAVDSSATAFMTATRYAISNIFKNQNATLLEPIMKVDITVPVDTYQPIMNSITKRNGDIYHTQTNGDYFNLCAKVALGEMFGFSTELRGFTQGQGEFSMEYYTHAQVPIDKLDGIVKRLKEHRKKNK